MFFRGERFWRGWWVPAARRTHPTMLPHGRRRPELRRNYFFRLDSNQSPATKITHNHANAAQALFAVSACSYAIHVSNAANSTAAIEMTINREGLIDGV